MLTALRALRQLSATLGSLAETASGLVGDSKRRENLVRSLEQGAELLQGGLKVESRHDCSGGVLEFRSLLQLDGDVSTSFCWTPSEEGPPQASLEAGQAALEEHFQKVERTMQPLRDLANLTLAGLGSLATLAAAAPATLQRVLLDLDGWLPWAVVSALAPALMVFAFRRLSLLAASRLQKHCGKIATRLNGEGDAASELKEQKRRDRQETTASAG